MKTLLVAGSDLGSVQGAFSFWEAKQTVIKGAVKYPQGSFEKPWGYQSFQAITLGENLFQLGNNTFLLCERRYRNNS